MRPTASWRAAAAKGSLAAPDGRRLPRHARPARATRMGSPARAGAPVEAADPLGHRPPRSLLMTAGTVHVIGAGLAGLAGRGRSRAGAAQGRRPRACPLCRGALPVLFRAGAWARDRQRQPSRAVRQSRASSAFSRRSGLPTPSPDPRRAEFAFADAKSGARWTLRPMLGACRGGSSPRAAASRGPAPSTTCALARSAHRKAGPHARRDGSLQRDTLRAAYCVPYFSPRSIPIRPPPRRRSQARSCARRWRGAAAACRPLIAAKGLGTAFIDSGARLPRTARRGRPLRSPAARARLRRRPRPRPRVRRRADRSRHRRRRHPRGPGWVAPLLVQGLSAPEEFLAHPQRSLQDCASVRLSENPRRTQRDDRMGFRLPRPDLRDR